MTTHPSLWSIAVHSPRVVVDFASDAFFENWEKIAVGFSLVVAGSFLTWILVIIAEKLTNESSSKRKQASSIHGYVNSTRKSKNSIIRVIFIVCAMAIFLFSFSIAFAVAGVNFFSVAFSLGLVALFIGSAFGSTLKNIGAFFMISITDKIEQGWVIDVNGLTGKVTGIHITWVELEIVKLIINPETNKKEKIPCEIYIPTSFVYEYPIVRLLDKNRYDLYLQHQTTTKQKSPEFANYAKKKNTRRRVNQNV